MAPQCTIMTTHQSGKIMGDRQLRGRRNEALHTPLVLLGIPTLLMHSQQTASPGLRVEGRLPNMPVPSPSPTSLTPHPLLALLETMWDRQLGGGRNKALLTSLVLLGIHTTLIHFQQLTKHGLRAANMPTPSLNTTMLTPDPSLMTTPIALTPTLRVFPQPT